MPLTRESIEYTSGPFVLVTLKIAEIQGDARVASLKGDAAQVGAMQRTDVLCAFLVRSTSTRDDQQTVS